MALEHLADLLHSWKAYLDSPAPGPNQIEAVFYTIVVNSPMFSGASGNEVSYISGVFTQYTTAPLTFSGGTLKVMALYSDKQDEATGQPFDIKQSDEVAVTLADAVLGSQGETTQLPTISAGQHVYQIVDVRNDVIIAVLDEVNNPAVLTLTFLCSPLVSV